MPTRKSTASANRKAKAALAAATEAARKRLGLETLVTRGRDALDFHDISVASLRDVIDMAFEIGLKAGADIGFDAGYRAGVEAERIFRK